ncbi:MAG: Maf family protein, partial [Defluviitaleaceae bacterium]|nr:Maf family protein [Defluviitaleaceae bacterium]
IALRKAKAVFFAREKNACGALPIFAHEKNDEIIVAADTLVYIDGEVLGKPKNFDEAFAMLKKLSGRRHTVFTGVAILRGEYEKIFFDATQVFFRELSDEEIFSYIATGEPFDKAGAYGVQERGAVLVEKIDGDFFTVVGLPISKVWQVLTLELELKF